MIGAMMRKLVHVAFGVLKSGQSFDPAFHGLDRIDSIYAGFHPGLTKDRNQAIVGSGGVISYKKGVFMKALLILLIWFCLGSIEAQAIPVTFTAALSGMNENPTTPSPATGSATVIYDDVAHTLLVDITFSGLLAGNTAAHIHCCIDPPGNTGVATPTPTFPGFPPGTAGSYLHVFDLTLSSSFNGAFLIANGGTPAGAEAALGAGLAAGQAYVNIHSTIFSTGEIRGFLTQAVPELDATSGTVALALLGGVLTLSRDCRPRR
jgi:hypothetical protein